MYVYGLTQVKKIHVANQTLAYLIHLQYVSVASYNYSDELVITQAIVMHNSYCICNSHSMCTITFF